MEATKRIRELPEGDKVKIIAVTASAYAEQRDEMLAAGMDDYVSKPYRASEIYDCLAKHLEVEYIYKDTPKPPNKNIRLRPEMLKSLPQELLDELKEVLISLEPERINTTIKKVAQVDPDLGNKLNHYASNFNYPGILHVIKKI
jgi:DNA-binding response OmpR family regulator